jgi:integrase
MIPSEHLSRDRALLLLGFAGAFRRSELVALNLEDIEDTPDGMKITGSSEEYAPGRKCSPGAQWQVAPERTSTDARRPSAGIVVMRLIRNQ